MKKLSLKNKYLLIAAAVVTTLGGCKKIEDLVIYRDPMQMDPQIWQQEAAVQYLLNDAYQFIMPAFPYEYTINNFGMHLASDENYFSATENYAKKFLRVGGELIPNDCRYVANKYAGSNYGDNRYYDVAKCNLAIKNLPGSTGIPEAAKKELLGQFYALRGMMYFGLTKMYGGMPLVLEPQDPQNLTLGGREKARVMFDQILKDYDSAIVNLEGVVYDATTERGKINKLQVLCLKAQALKWWASPLFNPKGDASRWDKAFAAIEAAYNACNGPYSLMSDYRKIFITEGSLQTEAIIIRSYSPSQPKRFQQVESRSRPLSEGGNPNDCYNPSQQMIDAYTMKDGRPIADTNKSKTLYVYDTLMFWANRDPRFDATIVWNGAKWGLSNKEKRKQWTYLNATYGGVKESTKPFYVRKFSDTVMAKTNVGAANDLGGNGFDWIEYRFAELILDYAEAANETGKLSLAKDLVKKIRVRAGIELGQFNYGLDLATNQAEMRDLILNERMVELAFEGKRNDDLRRTRRLHLLQGTVAQMKQIETISKAMFDELEKPIGTNSLGLDPSTPRRDTVNMYDKASVQRYFQQGYSWTIPNGNTNFAIPESYYWFSLANTFMNSSPMLEQTIGWDGGTFDPLSE